MRPPDCLLSAQPLPAPPAPCNIPRQCSRLCQGVYITSTPRHCLEWIRTAGASWRFSAHLTDPHCKVLQARSFTVCSPTSCCQPCCYPSQQRAQRPLLARLSLSPRPTVLLSPATIRIRQQALLARNHLGPRSSTASDAPRFLLVAGALVSFGTPSTHFRGLKSSCTCAHALAAAPRARIAQTYAGARARARDAQTIDRRTHRHYCAHSTARASSQDFSASLPIYTLAPCTRSRSCICNFRSPCAISSPSTRFEVKFFCRIR